MSRVEVNAIQTKLKAAIQSHQMLVVKMKGDKQNAAFKRRLADLQEEIKRLSEEQKKIVVKLRESLVKSTGPTQLAGHPVVSVGQTITAIGQPRIVSFPTQGGTTILPMGMVAVPIAHMQRPAVGVAIHAANASQLSQAASLSILPSGIISSGCGINLNSLNTGISIGGHMGINNNNIGLVHGNIAVNSISDDLGMARVNGFNSNVLNTTSGMCGISGNNSTSSVSSNVGCVSSSSSSNITSLHNLISNNSSATFTNGNLTGNASTVPGHFCVINGQPSPAVSQPSCNTASIIAASTTTTTTTSTTTTTTSSSSALVVSPFPQQPLVQPQLLQQQQQQILHMIQQQQHQPPQPRLSSSLLPIKVPQYTASHVRSPVTTTTVQYCSIAPTPSTMVTTTVPSTAAPAVTLKPSAVSSSIPTPVKQGTTKVSLPPASTMSESSELKEKSRMSSKAERSKPPRPQSRQDNPPQAVPERSAVSSKQSSAHRMEKVRFMHALGLYTPEAITEMIHKKSERKRRSTANPHYSFHGGRRERPDALWSSFPAKKQKVGKSPKRGNNCSEGPGVATDHKETSKSSKNRDNHDDYCAACGKGGRLLMCETCRLVYHLDCLNPPLTEAPQRAWSCPKCLVSGKALSHLNTEALKKVQTYISKRASKEDEKKKLQRKSKEINNEKEFLETRAAELGQKMMEHEVLKEKLRGREKEVKRNIEKLSEFVKNFEHTNTSINNIPLTSS